MNSKIIAFIQSVLLITTATLYSQTEAPVQQSKKSTDKVKIEGKYYYIHIVRRGETLYSISKTYNVSQMEIAMENPDIYLGIQVDQALKIPINDASWLAQETGKDDDYIYHIVRKGETLFGLSKKYSISMEVIMKQNPEVEQGIKISQVILIPRRREKGDQPKKNDKAERFIYHEVQPREGFYSLYRKYGISEQTIKRFNANLVTEGLKLGTILKVPTNPLDTIPEDFKTPPLNITDAGNMEALPLSTMNNCDINAASKNKKTNFNVALLLPLFTHEFENPAADSVNLLPGKNRQPVKHQIPQRSINFLDFYQGALMALDSMKSTNLSINLSVFDTDSKSSRSKELLKEKGLREANLIVGPIYPETLKPVSEFARDNRIPIVSPLSSNNYLLTNNPYLVQVNPSFFTQLKEFTNKLHFCDNQNVVIIHDADSTNQSMLESFKGMIKARILQCNQSELIHFKEVSYRPGSPAPAIQEKISHSLMYEKENIIIVPSNNEAFVVDLLGNLHTLATYYNYPMSLYGFPRWQRFKSAQLEYYYKLQLHLFSPFQASYSNSEVKRFVEQYRTKFRAEPSQFSFQGYDVFLYFLSAMAKYGTEFIPCLPSHKVDLLQSEFNFKRVGPNDGYENTGVFLMRYNPNFEIVKIR